MKNVAAAAIAGLLALPVYSQEFSTGVILSEMNDISAVLDAGEMTKADYIEVLSSGCNLFENAVESKLIENSREITQLAFRFEAVNAESVTAFARSDQFFEIETAIFAVAGASSQTVSLLASVIAESEREVSFGYMESDNSLVDLQGETCNLLTTVVSDVEASNEISAESPANERDRSTARSLATGALGVATMALDGLWMKGSGGLGAMIGGSASMGWGWNRVERLYFDLFEQ